MHLILKSCHTTGIIPVCFPLKSESSPFVYLRNSNTTGQPTDSIILVRCKYRGNQQESPSCYTASTATRRFWSFLNTVVIIRIVLFYTRLLLYFFFRGARGIIVDASHPQRYTDVIRSMSIFQRERKERNAFIRRINCWARNNLNAFAAQTNFTGFFRCCRGNVFDACFWFRCLLPTIDYFIIILIIIILYSRSR